MFTTAETAAALAPFRRRPTALLTSFKRDGTPVATPVTIAVDGPRAYMRTYHSAGKAKRMRREPTVRIAPSTMRGRPRGDAITARARLLEGEEAARAARAIARRQPILQGLFVPLWHRLNHLRTLHYELTPLPDAAPGADAGAVTRMPARA